MNTRNVIGARITAVNQRRVLDEGTGNYVYDVESIDLDNGQRITFAGLDGPGVTATVCNHVANVPT